MRCTEGPRTNENIINISTHRRLAIRRQAHALLRLRSRPILRPRPPSLPVRAPVSRHATSPRDAARVRVVSRVGRRLGAVAPVENGLVSRAHVLIELVRLVHLVDLGLFGVEPALEELRVVAREVLVSVLDLAELELERADFVV